MITHASQPVDLEVVRRELDEILSYRTHATAIVETLIQEIELRRAGKPSPSKLDLHDASYAFQQQYPVRNRITELFMLLTKEVERLRTGGTARAESGDDPFRGIEGIA